MKLLKIKIIVTILFTTMLCSSAFLNSNQVLAGTPDEYTYTSSVYLGNTFDWEIYAGYENTDGIYTDHFQAGNYLNAEVVMDPSTSVDPHNVELCGVLNISYEQVDLTIEQEDFLFELAYDYPLIRPVKYENSTSIYSYFDLLYLEYLGLENDYTTGEGYYSQEEYTVEYHHYNNELYYTYSRLYETYDEHENVLTREEEYQNVVYDTLSGFIKYFSSFNMNENWTSGYTYTEKQLTFARYEDFTPDVDGVSSVEFHESIFGGAEYHWKITTLDFSDNFPGEFMDEVTYELNDIISIWISHDLPTDIEILDGFNYIDYFYYQRNFREMTDWEYEAIYEMIFTNIPIMPTTLVYDNGTETSFFDIAEGYYQYLQEFNNPPFYETSYTYTSEHFEATTFTHHTYDDGPDNFTMTFKYDINTGLMVYSEIAVAGYLDGGETFEATIVVESMLSYEIDFASMAEVTYHESIIQSAEFHWKITTFNFSANFPAEFMDEVTYELNDIISIWISHDLPTDIETALDWQYRDYFYYARNFQDMTDWEYEAIYEMIFAEAPAPIIPTTIMWDNGTETSLFELFYDYWQYRENFNNDYIWFNSMLTNEYLELVTYSFVTRENEGFDTEAFQVTMRFDLETGILIHNEVEFEGTLGTETVTGHLIVEKLPDFVIDFASMSSVVFHESIVEGATFNWKITTLDYSANYPEEWIEDFFKLGDFITANLLSDPPTDIETALDWQYEDIFEFLRNGDFMTSDEENMLEEAIFPMILPIIPTTIIWDNGTETSLFELFYDYWQYRTVFNNDYQWVSSTLTSEYLEITEYRYYTSEDGTEEHQITLRYDVETGILISNTYEFVGVFDGEEFSVTLIVEFTEETYVPTNESTTDEGTLDIPFDWAYGILSLSFIAIVSIVVKKRRR